MKGLFSKLAAIVLGLSMATGVGVAVVANTSNVISAVAEDATMAPGTNGSAAVVKVDSTEYDAIKVGTSSKGGTMTVTVPAGSTNLTLYAAAWKGVTGLSLSVTPNNKISPSSIDLNPNNGMTSKSPFTLSGSQDSYKYEFSLSNITASTQFTFTTSDKKRFVAWGASATVSKTLSSITVSDHSGNTWYSGDTLHASDLTVTPTYSTGAGTAVTDGTGVYFDNNHSQTTYILSQGTNSVMVYYTDAYGSADKSISISAQSARTLSSISVSGQTTSFIQNDTFAFGGTVTANYTNGTSKNVTADATFTGYNMAGSGSQTVTVSYSENNVTKTTTYGINVLALQEVTFTPGTDTGDTSVTKNSIEVTMTTMNNAEYYQIYANQTGTFTVPSGTSIYKIEFSCTKSGTEKYGPGNASADVGSYSYGGSTGTWVSSEGESSVTISTTQQIRMTALSVFIMGGPFVKSVSMSGSPAADSVVVGGSEWTMSATADIENDSGSTLSRNINWTVSPENAVSFSKNPSLSGESITVTVTNANKTGVVITASSAATGYTDVNATSNTFSIAKSGVVSSVSVNTTSGQTSFDAQGASNYVVNMTTAVTYSGTAGAGIVNLSANPSGGVSLSSGKNFTAGAFTATFYKSGTYTITSTSIENSLKTASITVTVSNVDFSGYELIDSLNDIVPSTGRYVFYFVKDSAAKSTTAVAVSGTGTATKGDYYNTVSYTIPSIPGNIIPLSDVSANNMQVFAFENATGGYYLKDITQGKYLKTIDENTGLSFEDSTSTASVWTVNEEDGVFYIGPADYPSRWFELNTDQDLNRVGTYKGTQHSRCYVYKLYDTSKSFVLGQTNIYTGILGPRTIDAIAKNGANATVSWSITNTSVATITATSGLSVEIEGASIGQTTLTATFTALDGETYPALTCTINVIDLSEHVEIGVTTFTKVTSKPSGGWGGVYLFVDEYNNTCLDGSRAPVTSHTKEVSIRGNTISASIEMIAASFMIAPEGNNYTINSYSDNYIGNQKVNTNGIMSSYTEAYQVSIDDNGLITGLQNDGSTTNTELKTYGTSGSDNYGIKFYNNSASQGRHPITLWKSNGQVVEISSTLRTFYQNNKNNLHCVDTSKTQGQSTINWSALTSAYNSLSSDDKSILTNMAAKAAELKGNYLEAFISRYDYCVAKLGYTDFMGREAAGTLSVSRSNNNAINFIAEVGDAGIVIAVASLLGLSVITGYFFVRKRKVH